MTNKPRTNALMLALATAGAGCASLGESDVEADRMYLAAVQGGTPIESVAALVTEAGADYDRLYPTLNIVRFSASPESHAELEGHPSFVHVEPVLGVDADGAVATSEPPPGLTNTQVVPWGVSRVGGVAATSGATLWVLDSGVDLDHEDLNIDRERSIDMVSFFGEPDEPDTTHGTAVAGVAAAIDNDRDVVGVAAGAKVVSVRVLDSSGSGRSDVFIAGLEHATANADLGDVLNLSLAAAGSSPVIETAVARAADTGVSVVLAAGNAGLDAGNFTPAGVDHTGVYTVSAIDQAGCLATFSNYGQVVDIAAPGEDILTLKPGGGTAVYDGTSFAAPHVAGLLLRGQLASDGSLCGDRDDVAEPIAHN